MIVMSWDHSRDFLSNHAVSARGSERWSGPLTDYDDNILVFLQRFVSHFCAPGFFFTMGFAMYMLSTSRAAKRGWGAGDIIRHFIVRGFILLVVGRLVDLALAPLLIPIAVQNQTLFPKAGAGGANATSSSTPFRGPMWLAPLIGIWEVMTALGFTMMLQGILIPLLLAVERRAARAGQWISVGIGVLTIAASTFLILRAQNGDPCGPACEAHNNGNGTTTITFPRFGAVADGGLETFLRFSVYPGAFAFGDILYPVIPWIGVCQFGFAFGPLFKRNASQAFRVSGVVGCFCLVAFLVIRLWGGSGAGNLRGWPRGEGSRVDFIAFLTVSKYPPSVAYLLLTLGVDLSLLAVLKAWLGDGENSKSEANSFAVHVLLVFGQVPLFFYTLHFWLLGCIGFCIRWFAVGLPIEFVTLPWLCMLVFLFYICRRYRAFKQGKRYDSWWKLI